MFDSTTRVIPAALGTWSFGAMLLLASCGLSEEQWSGQAATVSCQTLRRCDPIDFHRDFADLDACVEATDPGEFEGCSYDEAAARDCREALRWSCARIGREYDDVVARCESVWKCDTGVIVERPGLL
ncbi:MAG: hypothetical protein AAF602_25235 [Myxococcota bacterium]